MPFLRRSIAPLLVILVFLVSLVVVSARSFLPGDRVAPATVEAPYAAASHPSDAALADLPPSLEVLVYGMPTDPNLS